MCFVWLLLFSLELVGLFCLTSCLFEFCLFVLYPLDLLGVTVGGEISCALTVASVTDMCSAIWVQPVGADGFCLYLPSVFLVRIMKDRYP